MQTSMSFRDVTRYDYTAVKPGLFSRIARFFKAVLAVKESNEHGLSDAMEARLYL